MRIPGLRPKPLSNEKSPGPMGLKRHRDTSRTGAFNRRRPHQGRQGSNVIATSAGPARLAPTTSEARPSPLRSQAGFPRFGIRHPCSRTPSRTTASTRGPKEPPRRQARGRRDARTCDVKQVLRQSERRNDYSNRLATEPLLYTFLMVCANSGASVTTLILPVWRSSGTGTALVTTTSSMQEFSRRS